MNLSEPGLSTGIAASTGSQAPSLEEVQQLPKVELHAHLGGSISQDFLVELLRRRGFPDGTFKKFDPMEDLSRSMEQAFAYFDAVNAVVTDLEALYACAVHVFEAFARENVVYLELRTTTKRFLRLAPPHSQEEAPPPGDERTTSDEYVETVLRAYGDFCKAHGAGQAEEPPMDVRLLLSVDRGRVGSAEDARAQVDDVKRLARRFPDFVVGVDVCGNPLKRSVVPHLLPVMMESADFFRGENYPVTFHCGEVEDEQEVGAILDACDELNVKRLGHCCYVGEANRERLLEASRQREERRTANPGSDAFLGVELCPTSNMVTTRDPDLRNHHFGKYWCRCSCAVCTDDTGLFGCNLSGELRQLAQAFGLGLAELREMQRATLAISFHRNKAALAERLH